MKVISRSFRFIYSIYALLTFIAVMLLVFPFIIIASLFGVKGGNIIYQLCSIWSQFWYLLIGMRHQEIYETPHNKNRQYIFVGNHISYMDVPPIVLAIHQPVRVLGKYEMIKIPIFGWIYRTAVILVDRRNVALRAKSVRALKAAIAKGISIFIFPEGTFNESEKPLKFFYDGAFRIAIETQTPIKPLLLIDTFERMNYNKGLFTLTPGKNRVVYLQEISVNNYTLKEVHKLKNEVYRVMEDGLKRYRNYTNLY